MPGMNLTIINNGDNPVTIKWAKVNTEYNVGALDDVESDTLEPDEEIEIEECDRVLSIEEDADDAEDDEDSDEDEDDDEDSDD